MAILDNGKKGKRGYGGSKYAKEQFESSTNPKVSTSVVGKDRFKNAVKTTYEVDTTGYAQGRKVSPKGGFPYKATREGSAGPSYGFINRRSSALSSLIGKRKMK